MFWEYHKSWKSEKSKTSACRKTDEIRAINLWKSWIWIWNGNCNFCQFRWKDESIFKSTYSVRWAKLGSWSLGSCRAGTGGVQLGGPQPQCFKALSKNWQVNLIEELDMSATAFQAPTKTPQCVRWCGGGAMAAAILSYFTVDLSQTTNRTQQPNAFQARQVVWSCPRFYAS